MKKNYKIGIALGGGAARGYAHIGVLNAIDELNIPISYISGEGDTETAETGKSSTPRPSFSRKTLTRWPCTLSCPLRCHWRRRGGSSGPASWIIRRAAASMSGAAGLGGGRCDGSACCPPHFSPSRYGWPPQPNVCPFAPQLGHRARTPPLIPKTGN